jgi:hypothetical protein
MKVIIERSNNLKVKREREKQSYLRRDRIQSQEKVSQNFFILKTVEQRNSYKSFFEYRIDFKTSNKIVFNYENTLKVRN